MAKKYEYHKRNDYPGERVAEKKRVADREKEADKKADARVAEKNRVEKLNADARVARKGRRDDKLMASEKQRSADRAQRTNLKRNAADTFGLAVIGVLFFLLAGSVWVMAGFVWGWW